MSLKSSGLASVVQKSEIPWAKVFTDAPLAPELQAQIHPKAPFERHGVHSQLMEVGPAALKPGKAQGDSLQLRKWPEIMISHQKLLLKAILHHDGMYKADKLLKAFLFRTF